MNSVLFPCTVKNLSTKIFKFFATLSEEHFFIKKRHYSTSLNWFLNRNSSYSCWDMPNIWGKIKQLNYCWPHLLHVIIYFMTYSYTYSIYKYVQLYLYTAINTNKQGYYVFIYKCIQWEKGVLANIAKGLLFREGGHGNTQTWRFMSAHPRNIIRPFCFEVVVLTQREHSSIEDQALYFLSSSIRPTPPSRPPIQRQIL